VAGRNAIRARSSARKFAMQALYQWQMTQHPADVLREQYQQEADFAAIDTEFFDELVGQCIDRHEEFDALLLPYLDRPIAQLDPIEHSILLLAMYELTSRPDVPYRVVISEAVALTKRFGATDGHKYVNAIVDRAARTLRAEESAR
jgi:N utilization substance protein B